MYKSAKFAKKKKIINFLNIRQIDRKMIHVYLFEFDCMVDYFYYLNFSC